MHTLSAARSNRSHRLSVSTAAGTAFIDITDRLDAVVRSARIEVGLLTVQVCHTTAAIVVNERETLLVTDFERLLERVAPAAAAYAHDDIDRRPDVPADEPRNGHAHCRALLLPTSATLTIVNGCLALGRWQRVFLVELDGPRDRELSVVAIGESLL